MNDENIKPILEELKNEFQKAIDWFKNEISGLRGSRLSVEIFDNIKVNCYNSTMSLKEVASLSLIDSRTISVEPWDKSLIPTLEKCLSTSGLEGNIKNDGKRLLFSIPVISQEDRERIIKVLREKQEKAKVSLRHIRDDAWKKAQEMERENKLTEDEKFQAKDELQELINDAEKEIDKITETKEKEIMS